MAANLIPIPPPAPNRTDEPDKFNSRANATMAYWPVFVDALNGAIPSINLAAQVAPVAVGTANFKGRWSDLTGARTMPTSVIHNGAIWVLLQNLQNIALDEPGVTQNWANLTAILDSFPAEEISNYVPKSDAATVAQFLSGAANKHLTANRVWDAASVATLTSGTSIAPNMGQAINFKLTISHNATLAPPTGGKVGQNGFIEVTQDATGGRTLSFSTRYSSDFGRLPVISAEAGSTSLLFYSVISASRIFLGGAKRVWS